MENVFKILQWSTGNQSLLGEGGPVHAQRLVSWMSLDLITLTTKINADNQGAWGFEYESPECM